MYITEGVYLLLMLRQAPSTCTKPGLHSHLFVWDIHLELATGQPPLVSQLHLQSTERAVHLMSATSLQHFQHFINVTTVQCSSGSYSCTLCVKSVYYVCEEHFANSIFRSTTPNVPSYVPQILKGKLTNQVIELTSRTFPYMQVIASRSAIQNLMKW